MNTLSKLVREQIERDERKLRDALRESCADYGRFVESKPGTLTGPRVGKTRSEEQLDPDRYSHVPTDDPRRYAPESLVERIDRLIFDLIDRVHPNVLELAGWALAAIVIGALAGIAIALGAGCGA